MGKTYGKPPMTVEDSAKGITQLLLTAAQVQLKVRPFFALLAQLRTLSFFCNDVGFFLPQTTDAEVPDKLVKFEEKFKKSSIVFSTLDGELLPW